MLDCAMARTRLQLDADRHVLALRCALPRTSARLRDGRWCDADRDRDARRRRPVGALAGRGRLAQPDARDVRADRGGPWRDLAARVYPQTGPPIRDRHQVRMADVVIASLTRAARSRPTSPSAAPCGAGSTSRSTTRARTRDGDRARVRAARLGAVDPLERPEGRRDRRGLAAAGRALDAAQPAWRSRRPGGCCARPTRRTRATRSRRSPAERRPGTRARRSSPGRGSTAAGPTLVA